MACLACLLSIAVCLSIYLHITYHLATLYLPDEGVDSSSGGKGGGRRGAGYIHCSFLGWALGEVFLF